MGSLQPNLEDLNLRMMSCSVAATTKYSCFSRSSFPSKNYKSQTIGDRSDATSTRLLLQKSESHVVVGVENPGDVLRQVSVQNGFHVVANIN